MTKNRVTSKGGEIIVRWRRFFRPIETYFVTQMFVYGFILTLPNNTFYGHMHESVIIVGNEFQWGISLILVSLFLLYAMIQKKKRIKILSLCITSFVWSGVATMFLISSMRTGHVTTGTTYYVTAIFAFWLSYKIGGQQETDE
mgnify:FL=1